MPEDRGIHKEEISVSISTSAAFNSFQRSGLGIHGVSVHIRIPAWLNVKNKILVIQFIYDSILSSANILFLTEPALNCNNKQ